MMSLGGGDGTLAIGVLRAYPSMTGVVFDLAHVAEKARRNIAAAGIAERCEAVEGDALTAVPAGGDVYILSRVIHDWDDARATVILGNCRRAMSDGSRLLMIERGLPPRIDRSDGALAAILADLNMLVMNGGRERTEAEFRALCDSAGLRVTQIVPSESHGCIVEAVPRG